MSKVSLKKYLELQIIHEAEKRELTEKYKEENLVLAREAMEYRLSEMNNLRAQINDERGRYPSREFLDKVVDTLEAKIKPMELFQANLQGRILMLVGLAGGAMTLVLTIVTIVVNIVLFLLRK